MSYFYAAIYAIILRKNAQSIRVIYPINHVSQNRNQIELYTVTDVT